MPPLGFAVALPVLPLKQLTLVVVIAPADKEAAGSAMLVVPVFVHPFKSVTVTV